MAEQSQSDFATKLDRINAEIAGYQARVETAQALRKTMLDEYFEDYKKPSDLMAAVRTLAEQMHATPNRILKMLGEQINRGDTLVFNTDGEQIGVLYLADVFEVGESGTWEARDKDRMIWHMAHDRSTG